MSRWRRSSSSRVGSDEFWRRVESFEEGAKKNRTADNCCSNSRSMPDLLLNKMGTAASSSSSALAANYPGSAAKKTTRRRRKSRTTADDDEQYGEWGMKEEDDDDALGDDGHERTHSQNKMMKNVDYRLVK